MNILKYYFFYNKQTFKESQKQEILQRLEQLKKEVQDILNSIDMAPSITLQERTPLVARNSAVQSKDTQVISCENTQLLNKPELEDLVDTTNKS